MPTPSSGTTTSPARTAAGIFAGFALLAAVNGAAVAIAVPLPPAGAPLRLEHLLFDAAETVGVGAVLAAVVIAVQRLAGPRWWAALGILAAAAAAIVHRAMGDNVYRAAALSLGGRFEPALVAVYVALIGLAFPTTCVAVASAPPILRLAALVVAIGGMIADQVILRDDYLGVHGILAAGAALVAGASVGPVAERAVRFLARRLTGRVALGAGALFAIGGVVFPPPNAVRFELFRQPCALASWALAATVWRAPGPAAPPPPASPWFQDRSAAPPVPPTSPRLLPAGPVVVLVTIDALRADVVSDPANDALLPTFAELKREGAVFTRATAAGSQTALSLGTLFSGRYFSELAWTRFGEPQLRFPYPAGDPAPRFPAILSRHDVTTVIYASIRFLGQEYGVARGFSEEHLRVQGIRHGHAREVIDPLLTRLRHAGNDPIFLYTHLMEPHAPYDRGRTEGSPKERYLSEVAVADAQLGRVLDLMKRHLKDRWVLIVAADHGEAFGEHQSFEHSKNLYEELLHVPLIVRGPRIRPRTIDQRVGLVDLGPTLLDLFGVETPANYEGQSLAPLLAGEQVTLARPLLAEGRLRRSLTLPDGLKVIDDPRRKVVEVYDLAADPGETHNLFDADPARAVPALATLRAFFAVHALTAGGYEPPYHH
jgi:hypothetical protein